MEAVEALLDAVMPPEKRGEEVARSINGLRDIRT
jgi:hypothetical protein